MIHPSSEEKMEENKETVMVRFTEQQLVLLESLRREGRYGDTMAEVVRNVMREAVRNALAHVRL
jgi:Arc/MetJ-type ribon-helix-helix transcriptional regulator